MSYYKKGNLERGRTNQERNKYKVALPEGGAQAESELSGEAKRSEACYNISGNQVVDTT